MGGLSVLNQCKKLLPDESFIYIFDRSHAPYGNKSDDDIKACALAVAEKTGKSALQGNSRGLQHRFRNGNERAQKKDKRAGNRRLPADRSRRRKMRGRKSADFVHRRNGSAKNFMYACSRAGKDKIIVSPQRLLASEIEKISRISRESNRFCIPRSNVTTTSARLRSAARITISSKA